MRYSLHNNNKQETANRTPIQCKTNVIHQQCTTECTSLPLHNFPTILNIDWPIFMMYNAPSKLSHTRLNRFYDRDIKLSSSKTRGKPGLGHINRDCGLKYAPHSRNDMLSLSSSSFSGGRTHY